MKKKDDLISKDICGAKRDKDDFYSQRCYKLSTSQDYKEITLSQFNTEGVLNYSQNYYISSYYTEITKDKLNLYCFKEVEEITKKFWRQYFNLSCLGEVTYKFCL